MTRQSTDAPSADNVAFDVANLRKQLDWGFIVGLAVTSAWITARWFPLSGLRVSATSSEWLMSLSCFVAVVTLLVSVACAPFVDKIRLSLGWKVFAFAWCVLGAVLVVAGENFGEDTFSSTAWIVLAGISTGIGSSLLLLTWFSECVQSANTLNLSLSFLIAAFVLLVYSWASRVAGNPFIIDTLFGVVLMSVSFLLLVFRKKTSVDNLHYALRSAPAPLKLLLGKICAGSFLVGLANELVRLVYSQGPVLFFRSDYSYVIVILVLAAMNIGIAWQLVAHKVSSFYFLCRSAIVLCVVGALLFPYVLSDDSPLLSISTAGRQCLQLLVWIIVFMLCVKHRFSPIVLFGLTCGVWNFGSFVGIVLHQLTVSMSDQSGGVFSVELVSVVAVFLLVVAFVFMFSEKDSDVVFGVGAAPVRVKAFSQACDYLVRTGGLTKREGEVLYLLAKGAPVSHIEQELYISSSTVSTHMKHIYQKLNVHSRKELYDAVERARALMRN